MAKKKTVALGELLLGKEKHEKQMARIENELNEDYI